MWTDLGVNLVLLLMSDYVFVLAVSNCNYMIFNFLNLNAGWIHRKDNPRVPRPFKAPLPLFVARHLHGVRERLPARGRRQRLGQGHAAGWAGSRRSSPSRSSTTATT